MKIYSCVPNKDQLDFWLKSGLNVLFHGRHGVGKTSIILEAFERKGLRFKQFSAATMDPWVDFIGVPKEMSDKKGPYLEMVRPKDLRDDEVEAIFFDEFNRSHKKVRNAVMELIQFKSINGKKFPHLKVIWAAVNPDDDDELKFDVEKLDPAQQDRFQIQIEIPYKPQISYFTEKYGKETARAAVDWWTQLPDNIKKEVSPRRLEYAVQLHNLGGNLLHVLPPSSNVDKLYHALKNGSPVREYRSLLKQGDEIALRDWLCNENNYSAVKNEILLLPQNSLHLLDEEKVVSLVSIDKSVADYVFSNFDKFEKTINAIADSTANKTLKSQAISVIQSNTGKINPCKIMELKKPRVPATISQRQSTVSTTYKWNAICKLSYDKVKHKVINPEPTLESCINACVNATEQTAERMRILNSAIRIIGLKPATAVTKEDAENALSIIDWVASKTQEHSIISKSDNLEECINVCANILKGLNITPFVKDFSSKYPFITGKLIYTDTPKFASTRCIIP